MRSIQSVRIEGNNNAVNKILAVIIRNLLPVLFYGLAHNNVITMLICLRKIFQKCINVLPHGCLYSSAYGYSKTFYVNLAKSKFGKALPLNESACMRRRESRKKQALLFNSVIWFSLNISSSFTLHPYLCSIVSHTFSSHISTCVVYAIFPFTFNTSLQALLSLNILKRFAPYVNTHKY